MAHPVHRYPSKNNSRLNPALCAGALTRLLWSFLALVLLWSAVFWAVS
ncbi:MAG: hypothetical protein WCK63_02755 [Betaproteobacteria bacterium]